MAFWSEISSDCLSYLGVSQYVKVLLLHAVEGMDILLGTQKKQKKKTIAVTFFGHMTRKKVFFNFLSLCSQITILEKKRVKIRDKMSKY